MDPPRAGATNMAIDEALFEGVKAGGLPALRLYRWDPPCLSFGRNQPARCTYDPERAAEAGIDIVRRPTGGLAVLHDRELTYGVAVPAGTIGGPRDTYLAINRALVQGLVRLGIPASTASPAPGPATPLDRSGRDPCFARAAPGEVAAEGRKLVGSAQRCERRTILQHGSILLDGDQSAVPELQAGAGATAQAAATTVRELLGRVPDPSALEAAIVTGFERELGIRFRTGELSPEEVRGVRELEEKYRNPEWTWRR